MTELEEKLVECFDEMAVFKDLKQSNFFSDLKLPSFLKILRVSLILRR